MSPLPFSNSLDRRNAPPLDRRRKTSLSRDATIVEDLVLRRYNLRKMSGGWRSQLAGSEGRLPPMLKAVAFSSCFQCGTTEI